MCYTDKGIYLTSPGGAPSTKAETMSSSEEDILVDRGGYSISLPRKCSVLKDNNAILEAQEVVELYLSDPSLWLWLGDLQVVAGCHYHVIYSAFIPSMRGLPHLVPY
jgi:hypothetical protein